MYDFLSKRGLTVALILAVVLSLITVLMFSGVEGELVKENPEAVNAGNFGMVSVYILGFACAALALILPTLNLVMTDPKKLLLPVAAILVLVILYFIGKGFASGTFDNPETEASLRPLISDATGTTVETFISEPELGDPNKTPEANFAEYCAGVIKSTGGALIMTYILFIIAMLSLVFAGVWRLIK